MPLPIYQSDQRPMDYLNEVIQSRPDREQQYQGALSQMKDAYARRSIEGDDAAQWAALAKGFARPAENFWQSLAQAGGAKADVVAGIEARELSRGQEAAMSEYKAATDLLKQDDLLTRAMAARVMGGTSGKGGRNMIKQGEVWLEKQLDGSWKPVAAGESALVDADYQHGVDQAAKILNTDDPAVVRDYALAYVEQKRALRAGTPTVAAQGQGASLPLTPVQLPGQAPAEVAPTVDRAAMLPQLLRDYEAALSAGNGTRVRELQQAINALRTAPTGQVQPVGGLPNVRLKTAESEGEMKARGEAKGKAEFDAYTDFQKQGTAAIDLTGQLGVMRELFAKHGDDIPSGELAPLIATIKSSLGSVGIQLAGTGPSDLINSIGTMGALKARTADGTNLMPGQMSNFDAQLLQKVFPQLSRSKEGRLLQIEIMQAQLRTRSEIAAAAREWYGKHKSFGPEWDNQAVSIMQKSPIYSPRKIAAMEEIARRLAKGAK